MVRSWLCAVSWGSPGPFWFNRNFFFLLRHSHSNLCISCSFKVFSVFHKPLYLQVQWQSSSSEHFGCNMGQATKVCVEQCHPKICKTFPCNIQLGPAWWNLVNWVWDEKCKDTQSRWWFRRVMNHQQNFKRKTNCTCWHLLEFFIRLRDTFGCI